MAGIGKIINGLWEWEYDLISYNESESESVECGILEVSIDSDTLLYDHAGGNLETRRDKSGHTGAGTQRIGRVRRPDQGLVYDVYDEIVWVRSRAYTKMRADEMRRDETERKQDQRLVLIGAPTAQPTTTSGSKAYNIYKTQART
ncbi:hypothetical protein B0H13DRAFT_1890728 [Mycena leptocephala]|nr:hypothetical protein B0H13DRAFT_1890728 [Mycena leptocephala]